MSSFKIPFGLKSGRLVEVVEVLSGLRCECVCPGCQKDLIARKGDINAHHFAHAHERDSDLCEYGTETAIHLMAKQILCEEKMIFAPLALVEKSGFDDRGQSHSASGSAFDKGSLTFDEAMSEKSIGDVIPDILASIDGEPFIVEFAVTHFCDKDKISAYQRDRLNVLEVDLRAFNKKLPTKDELRSYLIEEDSYREWLSLSSYSNVVKQVESDLQGKIAAANLRYKAKTVTRVMRSQPSKTLVTPQQRSDRITYSKKDVAKRWFVCPSCKMNQTAYSDWGVRFPEEVFLFSCTWEEAPWDAASVACPFCDRPVIINQGASYPLPD